MLTIRNDSLFMPLQVHWPLETENVNGCESIVIHKFQLLTALIPFLHSVRKFSLVTG